MNPTPRHGQEARRLQAWRPTQQGWSPRQLGGGARRQRRGRQPMDEACPGRRSGVPPAPPTTRCPTATDDRPAGSTAPTLAARPRGLWLPGATLDPQPDGRRHASGIGRFLSSTAWGPLMRSPPTEPAEAGATRSPAARGGTGALARRALGGHQTGTDAPRQTIRFIDESGFDPLPSVVRTDAPIG
jgi:hypothetical protein